MMKSTESEKKHKRPSPRPRFSSPDPRRVIAVSESAYAHIDAVTRDKNGKPTMSLKTYIDILVDADRQRIGASEGNAGGVG
jgi:hypothetical protein